MDPLAARRLGLTVQWVTHARMTGFWMVKDMAGRDLGSWVPLTRSARVGKVMWAGVDGAAALALFADLAKKGVGR